MIFLFGTKRCKHCNSQKQYLKSTFGEDGFKYVNVLDEKVLEIAVEMNIENIPSVVVFDDNDKEIFRKEGTVPPDQIFKAIYGSDCLPIKNNSNQIVLSYEPNVGRTIMLKSYSGKNFGEARVVQSYKIDVRALTDRQKIEYDKIGGRKDFAWIVLYEKSQEKTID